MLNVLSSVSFEIKVNQFFAPNDLYNPIFIFTFWNRFNRVIFHERAINAF